MPLELQSSNQLQRMVRTMVSFKRLTVDWLVYLFSLHLTGMVLETHDLRDSVYLGSNFSVMQNKNKEVVVLYFCFS